MFLKVLPRIPPNIVHIIILFSATRTMQGNTHSTTMERAGSGSAWSLVRSMKNARDDPKASEKTDTMRPTIIEGGNLPGKLVNTSWIEMVYQGQVSGVKFIGRPELSCLSLKLWRNEK